MKLKELVHKIRSADPRHHVAVGITVLSLAFGFLFPNALPRLIESFRDFGTSIAYYFCSLFEREHLIRPTVTAMPSWELAPSRWEPLTLFPWTWEEFKAGWTSYWPQFFNKENLLGYLSWLGSALLNFSRVFLLVIVPLIFVMLGFFSRYTSEINNDVGKESKRLKFVKKVQFRYIFPVVTWIKGFVGFIEQHKGHLYVWLVIWALHFNVISIVVSVFAFYFYFVVSFDFVNLYTQLLKLVHDLTSVIRFLPGIVWLVIGYLIYEHICRARALDKLYAMEDSNKAFISKRGLFTLVYGNMGVGKTQAITSFGITTEQWMRERALKIMLDNDLKFPNFPWMKLQYFIKECIRTRRIIDVRSCRKVIARMRSTDEYLFREENIKWWYRQCRKRGFGKNKFCFDYDLEHYRSEYCNGVSIKTIWDSIESYAAAFVIYVVYTSLIISNYSVRSDLVVEDNGNLPLYSFDYFWRDPRKRKEYSRFAHILDYDMVRLGVRMWRENPRKDAFGFGVYLYSEIDKELKNTPELAGIKRSDEECNQMNDMFIPHKKMERHAVVIDYKEFVKSFGDLQRPEDLRGSLRQVGELVCITERSAKVPTLPFCSFFWFIEGVLTKIVDKFLDFYLKYMCSRADGTLFLYFLHNLSAGLHHYCDSVNAKYGAEVLELDLESGRMEGGVKTAKWYLTAKDADRYSTNCLSAMFDSDTNEVGIMDLREYDTIMASEEELEYQNSHFHKERKDALKRDNGTDEEAELDKKLAVINCTILEAYSMLKESTVKSKKSSSDDES